MQPGLLAEASFSVFRVPGIAPRSPNDPPARTSCAKSTSVLCLFCLFLTTGVLVPETVAGNHSEAVSQNLITAGEDETLQDYLCILVCNKAKDDDGKKEKMAVPPTGIPLGEYRRDIPPGWGLRFAVYPR